MPVRSRTRRTRCRRRRSTFRTPHPFRGNRRLLDDDRLKALLNHVHPLVRGFAVEQISRHAEPHLLEALLGRFDDSDDSVALEAVAVIDHERYQAAAEPLLAAFAEAKGSRAVAFAGALATIAPGRLLEAVQAKGRLDDEAYRGVASALALTEAEPVRRFLDKALNRSGALNGERRGALYTAVLLSGDVALTNRVLSQAIDDSKREQPKDASFPSRAALSTLAGLPLSASRNEAGEELLKHTATLLERDVRPALDDKEAAALDDATRAGKPDEILNALQPVVGLTEHLADPDTGDKDDRSADRRSLVRRRRGLLEALVSRAKHIGSLEPTSGALFAAVASRAALTTLAGQLEEAKSEGLLALAKALEIDDPVALAARPEEKWASLFEGRSKRDMRRVVTVVVRESFRRAETLERLAKALTTSGHGRALLDAVAEVKEDTGIHELVIHAVASKPAEAEALVVDILGETPLPDDVVPLALMLGSMIRTERVAVAVGRRFYDIRQLARSLTAQTALRVADPRLLPLLESRAFDREPEELAWALLSLVHDVPQTGRLAEVIERIDAEARAHEQALDQELEPDHEPKLEVLMECEVCGETLRYRFDRAYVDAEAKDEMGDPAFVGPMVCKACGTEDRLKPTAETANVLTQHMLAFLQAAQAGQPPAQPPLVSPARTVVNGKEMGARSRPPHARRRRQDQSRQHSHAASPGSNPADPQAPRRRGRLGCRSRAGCGCGRSRRAAGHARHARPRPRPSRRAGHSGPEAG